MTLRTLIRPLLVLILAAATLIPAPSALAQTPNPRAPVVLSPPTPPTGKSDIPWMPYITAILLLIIVVGVNFIPSKRGHQD